MRIITFLLIASVLIVYEVQPRKLFKRNENEGTTYPTNQPPSKNCATCKNMEFKIKCGSKYNSDSCSGCELKCSCKDDKSPSPSPSPPPTTNPTSGPSPPSSPPLDETYPPPGPSPTDQTYPSPT